MGRASGKGRGEEKEEKLLQPLIADVAQSLGTDYYLLRDLLADEERELRDKVRTFANREVIPIIDEYWNKEEFPFELIPKLAELNVAGLL